MTTCLYTHPACLEHDPGRHHPESPARLRAVLTALGEPEFARLERREAPEATFDDLLRAHSRHHIEHILGAVPRSGHVGIDADTVLSPASGTAALRAAGAVTAAVDAVVSKMGCQLVYTVSTWRSRSISTRSGSDFGSAGV